MVCQPRNDSNGFEWFVVVKVVRNGLTVVRTDSECGSGQGSICIDVKFLSCSHVHVLTAYLFMLGESQEQGLQLWYLLDDLNNVVSRVVFVISD